MKSKKYVSKNQNLCLVLRHSIPAEPITGRQGVPGLYVRFKDGFLSIDEPTAQRMGVEYDELIELIERQPSFKEGFEPIDENEVDPWKDQRREAEPQHNIAEIKHGSVKNLTPRPVMSLTRDQQIAMNKMVNETASKMVKELAPKMAMEMIKEMAKGAKGGKKAGRPAKVQKEEVKVEEANVAEVKVEEENVRGASNPAESLSAENKAENSNK